MIRLRRALPIATVVVSFSAVLVFSALAQNESCFHRTVSLTIADRDWAPVPDLKPADFHAEYRGKPIKILSLARENLPHRIVIVLDASGSIGPGLTSGRNSWPLARQIASHLTDNKLTEASFALLIFNNKVIEQIDFSQATGAVAERLRQVGSDSNYQKTNVKGRTALLDTMLVGLGLLRDPTSADALYLITDGGEDASRASSVDVRRRLAASNSRVFVSLIATPGEYRSRSPEEANGPGEMSDIAHATGGAIFGPVAQGSSGPLLLGAEFNQNLTISAALNHFYQTMLGGYRMEIELPSVVEKWREWKLEFAKEKQRQFKDFQLGYTRDLAPCTEFQK